MKNPIGTKIEDLNLELINIDLESLNDQDLLEKFLDLALRYSIDSEARQIIRDKFRPIAWKRITAILSENNSFEVQVAERLFHLVRLYSATCTSILFNPIPSKFNTLTTQEIENQIRLYAAEPISGGDWEKHIEFVSLVKQYLILSEKKES